MLKIIIKKRPYFPHTVESQLRLTILQQSKISVSMLKTSCFSKMAKLVKRGRKDAHGVNYNHLTDKTFILEYNIHVLSSACSLGLDIGLLPLWQQRVWNRYRKLV